MQKIFAVTFKDDAGKFTVQDTDNFPLSYDTDAVPQMNPYTDFVENLVRKIGGDEAVTSLHALRSSLKETAVQAFMRRGYSETEAREYINRDVHYINWYIRFPSMAEFLPEGSFRMMPWKNPNWREDAKYLVEENPLPWTYDAIEDHFAHLHWEDDAATGRRLPTVRFFASAEHGMIRRTTTMKPGRYLTKFYPALDGDTVRDWATKLDAADGVRFAVTAQEIKFVYQNGPRSCMAYEDERYESTVHPVEVYGDSDIQLAFLSFVDLNAPNFRATARALVWPERKIYGRIYGDEQRMAAALEKLGYRSGSLKGAKIRKIEQGEYLVMPYVDGCFTITVNDDHCLIGGTVSADSTSGLIYLEDSRAYCNGWEDYVDEDADDFVYIRGVGDVSPSYRDEHCFFCAYYEEYYHNDDLVLMANGETWSQRAFDRYGATCERTDECYTRDELVALEDTGELVCLSWAQDNAHEVDGAWYAELPASDEDDMSEAA